jgi:hypothetical protein
MKRMPLDGLVEDREICGCINKNLPVSEIKDGRLNFTMEDENGE